MYSKEAHLASACVWCASLLRLQNKLAIQYNGYRAVVVREPAEAYNDHRNPPAVAQAHEISFAA